MSNMTKFLLASCLCLTVSCGTADSEKEAPDDVGTAVDAGRDGATSDMDTEEPDAPAPDDVGAPDLGATDVGVSDAGVSDSGAVDSGTDDVGTDMAEMGAPDMSTGDCDRTGLPTVEQTAVFDVPNDQFLYSAFSASPRGNDTYTFLSFEIYPYLGGMVAPQTYDFPGVNYANCNTCLLVFDECMRGSSCGRIYLVESGRAVVSAADTMDGAAFQATFNDVVLKEVTIDPNTFESTPVPGGETWCLDNFPANTVIDVMMN